MKIKSLILFGAALSMLSMPAAAKEPDDPIIVTTVEDNCTVSTPNINMGGQFIGKNYLLINGRNVAVTQDGYFSADMPLHLGSNVFVLKCEGYSEELTVNYALPDELTYNKVKYQPSEEIVTIYRGNNCYGIINSDNPAIYTKPAAAADNMAVGCCKGTTAQILGESKSFYLLNNDVYVKKEYVDVCAGTAANNRVSNVRVKTDSAEGYSQFLLTMDVPVPYDVKFGADYADLVLYNTTSLKMPIQQFICPLVRKIDKGAANYPNSMSYRFYFNNKNRVGGYDVSYDGSVMTLGFRIKPHLSDKNLSGASVLLCADTAIDSNTIGSVTGSSVNKAVVQAAADYLRKCGANVYVCEPAQMSERAKQIIPDLMLTIGTLTPSNTADALSMGGVTIYKGYDEITNAAEIINKNLTLKDTVFRANGLSRASLASTRYTQYPSLYISCGCMMNIKDYDILSKAENTNALGIAVGSAAEKYLQSIN